MNRPELRKIVITADSSERMLAGVAEAAPHSIIVEVTDPADIAHEIVDAQVTIGAKLSADQLAAAQELVWHHVPWVGVEGIITPELQQKGITLTNGSGTNAPNIAEHVVAMMLALARDLPRFVRDQEKHAWQAWEDESPHIFELGGQRVLCLGSGEIGQRVAQLLSAFGCEVVGASRSGRTTPGFTRNVTFDDLADELAAADHIVNSLPMTPSTEKIVDRPMIAAMKPGAFFYNVGRGGTIDQESLIVALQNGHLAGAGLDVTSPEPLPQDHPLWNAPNVLITSHTSGRSPMAKQRVADLVGEQVRRYRSGEPLLNVVDMTAGY